MTTLLLLSTPEKLQSILSQALATCSQVCDCSCSYLSMSNTAAASSRCSPMHSTCLFSIDFISISYQLQVNPLLGIYQTLKYAAPHLKTTLTHLEHLYFYCFSINYHPILPGFKRVYRQDCDLNTRQRISRSTKTWTFQI